MAREPVPLPAGFIAAIDVPVEYSKQAGKRLGVEVSLQSQPEPAEEGQHGVPVIIQLFTSPPTLAMGDQGKMLFHPATGRVIIATELDMVRITGQLADDRQSITGEVELTRIDFMGIVVEHLTRPIEMAGFEEQ